MTYSYECLICKNKFEIEKGINEEVEVQCECSSKEVKRIFTPIANVWNCSGAYGKGK